MNYPITDEMKLYTKLNTLLVFAIFKFIQPHLKDFKPSQIQQQNKQQSTTNTENSDQDLNIYSNIFFASWLVNV